jgi:hypothetical protein
VANAARVAAALLHGVPAHWHVALWGLDGVAPALAARTVGDGPGPRFELLNRALAATPADPGRWVVVVDDDVAVRPSLGRFVAVADRAGLDIAMPGHRACSFHSHPITRRRMASTARRTTYVEIGPVVAVRPRWVARLVPFPADDGLGWGTELAWSDLRREGCRLGIVDRTPVLHLVPPGRAYDRRAELARLVAELDARGVPPGTPRARMDALQRNEATWRPWRPSPPWAVAG